MRTSSTIFFLKLFKSSLSVIIYELSETGVWQDAIVLVGPSFFRAISTEHILQAPKGAKLGSSHKVGIFFFSYVFSNKF